MENQTLLLSGAPKRHVDLVHSGQLDLEGMWGMTLDYLTKNTLDDAMPLIVLKGPPGSGKTQMAVAVMHHNATALGRSGCYVRYTDLLVGVLEGHHRHNTLGKRMNRYTSDSLLIIDAISPSLFDQREHRVLSEILEIRLDRSYPTILVTRDAADDGVFYGLVGKSVAQYLQDVGAIQALCAPSYWLSPGARKSTGAAESSKPVPVETA